MKLFSTYWFIKIVSFDIENSAINLLIFKQIPVGFAYKHQRMKLSSYMCLLPILCHFCISNNTIKNRIIKFRQLNFYYMLLNNLAATERHDNARCSVMRYYNIKFRFVIEEVFKDRSGLVDNTSVINISILNISITSKFVNTT